MTKELVDTIVETLFKNKVDRGGKPYIQHIKRVAAPFDYDIVMYTSAMLHDVVEDIPGWSVVTIESVFGVEVSDIVAALTKKPAEAYFDYIERVIANKKALEIKKKDLEDNMNVSRLPSPLTRHDLSRIEKYHAAYTKLNNIIDLC